MSTPASRWAHQLQSLNSDLQRARTAHLRHSDDTERPTSCRASVSPGRPTPNTSVNVGFAMANDVLYDNLGILSLPPQVQQTCDVVDTGTARSRARIRTTNFLGAGGLPNTPAPITDPATARAAHQCVHPEPDAAVLGNLDGRRSAHLRQQVHVGSALRRNSRYSPAGADPPERPVSGNADQQPADVPGCSEPGLPRLADHHARPTEGDRQPDTGLCECRIH